MKHYQSRALSKKICKRGRCRSQTAGEKSHHVGFAELLTDCKRTHTEMVQMHGKPTVANQISMAKAKMRGRQTF